MGRKQTFLKVKAVNEVDSVSEVWEKRQPSYLQKCIINEAKVLKNQETAVFSC